MNTLIAISGLGILCLVAEILNIRKAIVPITITGLLAILGFNLSTYNEPGPYFDMIVVNPFSVMFSALFILITIFLIGLSHEYYKDRISKISDFVSIKIFMLAGAVAMVSFLNLSMFFLGIEVLSIALYILAASDRLNLRSNEAGMKYFLMGSFASGIILFGICLVYGATGTFNLTEIIGILSTYGIQYWYYLGLIFIIVGLLFKIAVVPFHFWAPDVYEGSPSMTTATMSTLAKIVAMATLFRITFMMLPIHIPELSYAIVGIAIASMLLGNVMALKQNNVKRMFAFSGISHAGFMLTSLLLTGLDSNMLLYYCTAYALAGISFFAVVLFVTRQKNSETIDAFNGFGQSHPLLSGILTASLLSMAGIPILSGFFAKFFLFHKLIQAGWLLIVLVGVLASIISVGYYFKIVLAMYTKESSEEILPKSPMAYKIIALVAISLNIVIGVMPNLILDLLK